MQSELSLGNKVRELKLNAALERLKHRYFAWLRDARSNGGADRRASQGHDFGDGGRVSPRRRKPPHASEAWAARVHDTRRAQGVVTEPLDMRRC